jgi:hypothetical protein
MSKNLYQTLRDDDNADGVESNGPYLCDLKSAWLGRGYYFWDSAIELAHWWGKSRYPQNGYIICRSIIHNDDEIFDLYNNHEHRTLFLKIAKEIANSRRQKTLMVPEIIEYIRLHTEVFNDFKGIRAHGTNSVGSKFSEFRFKFVGGSIAYLDTCPAIQYCITDKSVIRGYTIVYPNHYCI